MIDDVRLAVLGRVPVVGLNGFRTDPSAFGISPDVTVDSVRSALASLVAA